MADLTIVIPARNERWLKNTIDNILENMEGDTEIISVFDGEWSDPPIVDNPRVNVLYHNVARGQRVGVNDAVRLSKAKFVMKVDAHCMFDKGFDVKLMKDSEPNMVTIPRMYNLHVFDWKCQKCGLRTYQGPQPEKCSNCGNTDRSKIVEKLVWQPRWSRKTDFARFDTDLHFQYWGSYGLRPEARGDIADTMCFVGACRFMERELFWKLGGCDENHGSWGQEGVEWSCKTWLSGNRLVVNKKTWFSHLFRTQTGFSFPYSQSGKQQQHAKEYSKDLWTNNKWPGQIHDFKWILDKFYPIPGWHHSEAEAKEYEKWLTEKYGKVK